MKKIMVSVMAIVAIAAYLVVSDKIGQNDDLVIRNIEALSTSESSGCHFGVVAYDEGTNKLYCFDPGSRCCVYNPNFN